MGLNERPFDTIGESDISQLVTDGVSEGIGVEYKRDLYGPLDADKREYLKDISSLANTVGGHLVIGIDESGGVPQGVSPISINPDAELQRLESLTRDALEPRVIGIRMRAVRVGAGHVIVVRVPRSWNAPHRVAFKGSSRFYGRTSAGAYEYSVEELRSKFNASATGVQRAREFRHLRAALLRDNEGDLTLSSGDGLLVVHVVPVMEVDTKVLDLRRALEANESFRPIGASEGWTPRFNLDGFANVRASSGGATHGYTQLFRDGSLEAVKVGIVGTYQNVRRIPASSSATSLFRALECTSGVSNA